MEQYKQFIKNRTIKKILIICILIITLFSCKKEFYEQKNTQSQIEYEFQPDDGDTITWYLIKSDGTIKPITLEDIYGLKKDSTKKQH